MAFGLATAQATTISTSNPGQIAAFQSGATVQTFDGLTAQTITDYNATPATATTFNDPTQPNAWFNSGGGNFFNPPATDPTTATPIGIFAPSGGIAGNKLSGNNVAGPLEINTTTAFGSGAFMEILFPTAISKIGFYVPFIGAGQTLTLFLKDDGANNITGPDSGGALVSGQFVGITRSTADVRGLSILSSDGKFTIDDLTYGLVKSGGGGGGGGGGSTVPEGGNALNLAAAGAFLVLARRALKPKAA